MAQFIRMADLDLRAKRVLIREDLNVPLEAGKISATQRLEAALPSIKLALEKGASVMLMSHLGRPKEGQFAQADSLAKLPPDGSRRIRRARRWGTDKAISWTLL